MTSIKVVVTEEETIRIPRKTWQKIDEKALQNKILNNPKPTPVIPPQPSPVIYHIKKLTEVIKPNENKI